MGHERLSSGPRSHAPAERLAGRAHRSQISLPLVLLRFYSLLSPVRHGLVCERTDWISNPAGHERRADGSDGAYDDRADCWKTYGTHHWLCGRARHVGANSRPRDCRRQSATRILAVALSRQPAGRCIGNRIGRSFSAERELDVVGFVLLSPGLVLFLYGSDHIGERIGRLTLVLSIVLLTTFFRMAIRKGDRALIDLQLFRGKTFAASAVTQFMSNGVSFAGQMLIPIYLIRACGRSPSATGWLLAPLGVGMICSYPWMGALTQRFGIRKVSAGGAFLAFAATLPFLYLASHGLVVAVLACALFLRGVGLSAVGIPSISSAYASVQKRDLPMATTSLNIVQRLGGPTMTTICATFLGWRLGVHSHAPLPNPFTAALVLLCALHALLFAAALRLPPSIDKAAEHAPAEEPSVILEMMTE